MTQTRKSPAGGEADSVNANSTSFAPSVYRVSPFKVINAASVDHGDRHE